MPDRDSPGQRHGSTQEQDRAGAPPQREVPGREHLREPDPGQPGHFGGVPQQHGDGQHWQPEHGQPEHEQRWHWQPEDGQARHWEDGHGEPQGGFFPGYPQAGRPGLGGGVSPVSVERTNVVGRRVAQYFIDYILVGIIPALAEWLFNRGGATQVNQAGQQVGGGGVLGGFGWIVATVISLAVYFWYWVLRPLGHNGQTFGMQLLGLRVISKDGGPANAVQLFIRGILLLVDTLFFGLVGLVSMLVSHYHQRVGDHAAGTLVVAADGGDGGPGSGAGGGGGFERRDDEHEFARAGHGGSGQHESLSADHEPLGSEYERLTTREDARVARQM